MSGASAERSRLSTPTGLTRPDFSSGSAEVMSAKPSAVWFPATAAIAGPLPL